MPEREHYALGALWHSMHGVEKIKAMAAESRTRWKWELIFVHDLAISFRQKRWHGEFFL